jgi:hypothetical protein
MRLYLEELETELSQRVKADKITQVTYIRPHLYLHNIPSGSVKLQIWDSSGSTQIAQSDTIQFSNITTSNEYHGYVRFSINALLNKDTYYLMKIVSSGGYTFDESAYCAVCRDLGFKKYEYSVPATAVKNVPLDLEIYSKSSK